MTEIPKPQPPSPERQNQRLIEAINGAKTVTVEIGTGDRPLFKLDTGVVYDRNNLYVGVNVEELQHVHLQQLAVEVDGFAVLSALGREQKIEQLPLPDDIADEVFMGNVFGEPDSPHVMYRFWREDGTYYGHSGIDAKRATLAEAKRIMKPDGHLVILENNTPYLSEASGAGALKKSYDAMVEILQEAGFSINQALDQQSEAWERVVSNFSSHPNEMWSYRSYMVISSKQASVE